MFMDSYADVMADGQADAREVEASALDRAMQLLEKADNSPMDGVHALDFTRELWMTMMNDLADPLNALPDETKASLISIGIWIIKEAEAIRLGRSNNYTGIAEICGMIRDGLRRQH